jgi:hypothetical protein
LSFCVRSAHGAAAARGSSTRATVCQSDDATSPPAHERASTCRCRLLDRVHLQLLQQVAVQLSPTCRCYLPEATAGARCRCSLVPVLIRPLRRSPPVLLGDHVVVYPLATCIALAAVHIHAHHGAVLARGRGRRRPPPSSALAGGTAAGSMPLAAADASAVDSHRVRADRISTSVGGAPVAARPMQAEAPPMTDVDVRASGGGASAGGAAARLGLSCGFTR